MNEIFISVIFFFGGKKLQFAPVKFDWFVELLLNLKTYVNRRNLHEFVIFTNLYYFCTALSQPEHNTKEEKAHF